jgi:2-dehydro-3-deoxygalactonokinase
VTGIVEWVAVDWGTSNVRAWGIDSAGATVFSETSDQGMGRLGPGDYPGVLRNMLDGLLPAGDRTTAVLICGMAGARQGWIEAPYVETPAELTGLVSQAVRPDASGTALAPRILPGMCQRAGGHEDVIRGEETQLLGLLTLRPGFEGTVVMPGTHSKWVRVEGGRVTSFATAMTGELYDVLGTHSVLRHSLAGEQMGPLTEDGVSEGLAAGLERPGELTSLLFRTRAASLLSGRGADWCSGYLSGLLVGAEVGGHRDWLGEAVVPLIGSARLCRLYGAALERTGVRSEAVDATDATLAGLKAARSQEVA